MGAPKKGDAHRVRSHVATMHRLAITQALREITEAWEKAGRPPGGLRGIQGRIADQVGLHPSRVSRHLKAAREALPKLIETDALKIRDAIARRNADARKRLDKIEAELTSEWERSKAPQESSTSEFDAIVTTGPDGKPALKPTGTGRLRQQKQGRTGLAAYTAQLVAIEAERRALDEEMRELFGIDPPKKIAPTDPTGTKPYEGLTPEERAMKIAAIMDDIWRRKEKQT